MTKKIMGLAVKHPCHCEQVATQRSEDGRRVAIQEMTMVTKQKIPPWRD